MIIRSVACIIGAFNCELISFPAPLTVFRTTQPTKSNQPTDWTAGLISRAANETSVIARGTALVTRRMGVFWDHVDVRFPLAFHRARSHEPRSCGPAQEVQEHVAPLHRAAVMAAGYRSWTSGMLTSRRFADRTQHRSTR